MLYNVVLVSAVQQHESVVSMHVSPPSGEVKPFYLPQNLKQICFCNSASFNQAFWIYALGSVYSKSRTL